MGRLVPTPSCPVLALACALTLAAGAVAVAAEPVEDGWLAGVERRIAASEYAPSWQDDAPFADLDGGWQAPKRAQGYGLASDGTPRSPSHAACLPQAFDAATCE